MYIYTGIYVITTTKPMELHALPPTDSLASETHTAP
jgi:hypothetical protein